MSIYYILDTVISSLNKLTYFSYVSPTAHWEGTASVLQMRKWRHREAV